MRLLARAARSEGPERLPALRPAPPGRGALTFRLLAVALAALLLAGATAGCGGDEEEPETTPTVPDLTVPQTDEQPAPTTETTPPEPTETVPPSTDGGTPAPEPEPPADAPENDTPPPEDSPAERFEDFCNDNPGACG